MRTGSAIWPTRGRKSHHGSRTTTKVDRTVACSIVHQWSSPLSQQRPSTEMMWGKRPQTPAPCPTPPSPPRRKARGANKIRRKSHYPWTRDGGRSPASTYRAQFASVHIFNRTVAKREGDNGFGFPGQRLEG